MAEEAWRLHAESGRPIQAAGELADSRAYIQSLRQYADQAAILVSNADKEEKQSREVLTLAKREVRKLEIWRDELEKIDRADTTHRERVAADQVAARRSQQ